jgi:hypothetical protein
MSYTLNGSDGSPSIVLAPLAVDSTSTSLTFYGRGATNYGEGQQTNMLKLLENFASVTAPTTMIPGQLWYDKTTNILKVYTGTAWSTTAASATSAGTTTPSNPVLGQLWYDTNPLELCLKVYAAIGGSFGWIRVAISTIASSVAPDASHGYASPALGQLWYDTSHLVFKQYMGGTTWTAIEIKGSSTGATPPVNPVVGQLWFDTTNSALKVFDGLVWLGVTNVVTNPGVSAPASPQVGELWFNTTTNILEVYNGTAFISNQPDPALQYLAFVV